MTPAFMAFAARLMNGEVVRCKNSHDFVTEYRLCRGQIQFRLPSGYWQGAEHWPLESFQTEAERALPPEPEQPKRQVRSIDLSE